MLIRDAWFRREVNPDRDYQLTFPVAFWVAAYILHSTTLPPPPIHWIYAPAVTDEAGERILFAWRGTGWAFRLWWRWSK